MATSLKNPNMLVGDVGTPMTIVNRAVTLTSSGWQQASYLSGHYMSQGWCVQSTGTICWVLTKGTIVKQSHGWTVGSKLYLSTSGNITPTLTQTNIQQKVGYVLDANSFWFDPDLFIFEWS